MLAVVRNFLHISEVKLNNTEIIILFLSLTDFEEFIIT